MSEKVTIKAILELIKETAESGQIQSPNWWLKQALDLSALWQNLKDEMIKAEIDYHRVVDEMEIAHDCSHAKATIKAKIKQPKEEGGANEYQVFKYLEGRDKIVKEFIMLAKKGAQIETHYN